MDNRAEPIIVEQTYSASRETVWSAITDPAKMRRWFFTPIEDFRAEVGFETEFNIHNDGTDYLHQWKILEVIPKQSIVYDWRYKDIQGIGKVTWEISDADQGTNLKLTNEGLETFPDDDPSFTREAGEAGWNYFVRESLNNFLEGKTGKGYSG